MCHRVSEANAEIEAVLPLEVFQVVLLEGAQHLTVAHIQQLGIAELEAAFLLHLAGDLLAPLVLGVHREKLEHQQIDRRGHHSQTEQNEREREDHVANVVGQVVSFLLQCLLDEIIHEKSYLGGRGDKDSPQSHQSPPL